MESRLNHLDTYLASLRPYLQRLGLAGVSATSLDGRLTLTPEPFQVLPVRLELTGYVPGERYFKASRLVGVVHSKLPEGMTGPTQRLALLAELLVRLATPELVAELGPLRRRDPRLWNLDLADLVSRGLKPAAILNIENRLDVLGKVQARVPAAVLSTYAYVRNELDQLKWLKEGTRDGVGHKLVYCAQSEETAERLKELDWQRYHAPAGRNIELQTAIGVILGYPECCSAAYERELSDETELEDVRWLRAYLKEAEVRWSSGTATAGTPGGPENGVATSESGMCLLSPWTNFVAARMAHMLFFEHLPCSPWCDATVSQNRATAQSMFGAEALPWLEGLLQTSFFFWPDGRFVPFFAHAAEDGTIAVDSLGTAWSEGVIERYRPRLCTGEGLLPARPGEIRALRRVGSGRWQVLAGASWLDLGEGRSAPLVLPFAAN